MDTGGSYFQAGAVGLLAIMPLRDAKRLSIDKKQFEARDALGKEIVATIVLRARNACRGLDTKIRV